MEKIETLKRLTDIAIISDSADQIAIAKETISAGAFFQYENRTLEIKKKIKKGHRFALTDIPENEFVRQFGYPFGQSKGILQGELLTSLNVRSVLPKENGFKGQALKTKSFNDEIKNKTFSGYVRKNGDVGTRNYYLVIPSSMCVSEVSLQIAAELENKSDIEKEYRHIDGIRAIPHTEGCGCASTGQIERLLDVIKGYVRHPNVGGCLIIDLGCEQTNYERVNHYLKNTIAKESKPVDWITVQDSGGTRAAVEKSIGIIGSRLKEINDCKRTACSLDKLIIGAECGASDSFSGITANPVIGKTIDNIVMAGGSGIFSEIPEMVGTYEMLKPRFKNSDVAGKYKAAIKWYKNLAKKLDLTLEDNLVPKNIEGGLINNYLKSLGAVLKGGTMVIEDVLEYAEPLSKPGLHIMQGPGGDLESVTGLVASGANIVCFSTGFGAISGNAVCPVIKISSTDELYKKLPDDIDFNAGRLLEEKTTIDELSTKLLDTVIAVASGNITCSERLKQRQFQVWSAGKLSL